MKDDKKIEAAAIVIVAILYAGYIAVAAGTVGLAVGCMLKYLRS